MSGLEDLRLGERVLVGAAYGASGRVDIAPPRAGEVVRMRRSCASAWVALDVRLEDSLGLHPFADVHRATHVRAYPEDCEPENREAPRRRPRRCSACRMLDHDRRRCPWASLRGER